MRPDWQKIEKKWQKAWLAKKLWEANVEDKAKLFVNIPYPYVNGAPHIGHFYSFFRTDSYARFKRMQGYNVLFPQAFHATGQPIVGAVERLKSGDAVQIKTFKDSGATDKDIQNFIDDPRNAVDFWRARWIEDFNLAGFSIDWRRTFTTAIEPAYNAFISWQYRRLKEMGYVVQGTHPVIWCPRCQSPTGDHDRLEGEGESPTEYTLLKFRLDENDALVKERGSPIYLIGATLRPETIFGVVNIWVNPDAEYVVAEINEDLWIVSKHALPKLADQLKGVKDLGHIMGSELLGKRAKNPITGRSVPILPAHFVEPESSTGVVMSVPAHAPYDWAGVHDLLEKPAEMERFGVAAQELEPIVLIETPDLPSPPAVKIFEKMLIESQLERAKLDQATSEIYKKEFHTGVLNKTTGSYSGKKVSEVKQELIADFTSRGIADTMWEPTGTVVCRDRTRCHVKVLENQWFLKYSDTEWKAKATECIKAMTMHPESVRNDLLQVVDWLQDKACARRSGLGTPLPWDPSWIVETLSDSVIYMAFYTIAHLIKSEAVDISKLGDEVFDFIYLGKGNAKGVSEKSKIPATLLNSMAREFGYWYPSDMRVTAKEHIPNHLTFFIFHHVAMWPREKWPRGVAINGMLMVEGEKMSKSKGNMIPIRNIIKEHGSDMVRINLIGSGEGVEDPDWRSKNLEGYRNRLEVLAEIAAGIKKAKRKKRGRLDDWLLGEVQKAIRDATKAYEQLRYRTASQAALFNTTNALKWYMRRCGDIKNANPEILKYFFEDVSRLLAPLVPHFGEELWATLGKKPFIASAEWPVFQEEFINNHAERGEELVKKLLTDIQHIAKNIVKRQPKGVKLFVAKSQKWTVPDHRKEQLALLQEAAGFLGRELECKVEIMDGDTSSDLKADKASPEKPGILIE
jgi:leucyl-tRNA synthetase